MSLKTMEDLFIHELKDIYSAETQIVKALPKMAKAASSKELKQAFKGHLEQTKGHVKRLEDIFKQLDVSSRGPKCKGMAGLLEEGEGMIEEEGDERVKDAGLIAAAQRVEHYEIAAYGSARAFARLLDHEDAAELLEQTLEEESATDAALTELAESAINAQAVEA